MEERKEKLEQFEEAALALIMDSCAQRDGEKLLEEFEQAKANGQAPVVSESLDEKNTQLIRQTIRRQRGKEIRHTLSRIAAKAAIWLLLLVPLATATIMAVDANNQVYIDRFLQNGCSLSEMSDRYVIHFRLYPAVKEQDHDQISRIMRAYVPSEYSLSREYINDLGGGVCFGLYSCYQDDRGNIVRLDSAGSISGKVIVRKDGCSARELSYLGYDMVLVEWENAREIHWLDDAEGLRYSVYAEGLPERQFWDLIFELAKA